MARATNAISQRIRRIHGGLHQGSFGDSSLNLTVPQVNEMHASINAMYHDGTLMYSESEEETNYGKETYCTTIITEIFQALHKTFEYPTPFVSKRNITISMLLERRKL